MFFFLPHLWSNISSLYSQTSFQRLIHVNRIKCCLFARALCKCKSEFFRSTARQVSAAAKSLQNNITAQRQQRAATTLWHFLEGMQFFRRLIDSCLTGCKAANRIGPHGLRRKGQELLKAGRPIRAEIQLSWLEGKWRSRMEQPRGNTSWSVAITEASQGDCFKQIWPCGEHPRSPLGMETQEN